jgi:long-chain acyl-CoA synthetase
MTSPSLLADSFRAVLRDRGPDTLVMAPSEGLSLTAHDIDRQADHLWTALAARRLAAGHLVVASLGNASIVPAVVLACARHGLPLMPVDRSTPPAELRALADRWHAAAVLVPEGLDLQAPDDQAAEGCDRRRVPVGYGLAAWVATPCPAPGRHAPAALLKLTSGSTGEPRATSTEERHLVADVRHITEAMDIGPRTRQLAVIPLSHSYGFSNLVLPLLWQGTPLLLRPQFVPTQVVPDIRNARLETFAGVPFMFDHLARHQPLSHVDALRLVVSAGARLSFATVTAFHAATGLKVRSFYGSSETGGICFDDTEALDPRVPVGRPMGAARVDLVPDDEAPEGSGRVRVSGPGVIDRYAETGGPTFDGVFLTGDYARRDAAGIHELTGRVPSFVNVAGRKVQPQEVEAALRALPGVVDAVAMGIDDAVRGQALGACVVSEVPWDARAVRAALASRLAPYKLPRVVVVTGALPLTDRGKIDRPAVARLLGQA